MSCLIGSALVDSGSLWLRLVLIYRSNLGRQLEPLAECLSEPLQSRAWQSPNGGQDLLDGAWIERVKA